jgi:hypothetical protein
MKQLFQGNQAYVHGACRAIGEMKFVCALMLYEMVIGKEEVREKGAREGWKHGLG